MGTGHCTCESAGLPATSLGATRLKPCECPPSARPCPSPNRTVTETHWGSTSLKGPLLAVLSAVALAAAVIALFAWSPWEEPTEAEWIGAYAVWSDEIAGTLSSGGGVFRAACDATFEEEVGSPPTDRLEPVAEAARRGCATRSPLGWRDAEEAVIRTLAAVHGELAPPRQRRDIAAVARSSVGVRPNVYCWRPEAWAPFFEHYAIVRGGEETSLRGIADTGASRIDLDPSVCATLSRYLRRIRPLNLSSENLALAESLMVLTHQAEHLKAPSRPEAEVECYALQHVRPLVRAVWGPDFATEIALHAWEISYPRLPDYFRSPACREGGPLDRNPRSSDWP